jgi:hypothetical protein
LDFNASVLGFRLIYCCLSRKNKFPAGGLMVMLLVVPLSLMVIPPLFVVKVNWACTKAGATRSDANKNDPVIFLIFLDIKFSNQDSSGKTSCPAATSG